MHRTSGINIAAITVSVSLPLWWIWSPSFLLLNNFFTVGPLNFKFDRPITHFHQIHPKTHLQKATNSFKLNLQKQRRPHFLRKTSFCFILFFTNITLPHFHQTTKMIECKWYKLQIFTPHSIYQNSPFILWFLPHFFPKRLARHGTPQAVAVAGPAAIAAGLLQEIGVFGLAAAGGMPCGAGPWRGGVRWCITLNAPNLWIQAWFRLCFSIASFNLFTRG